MAARGRGRGRRGGPAAGGGGRGRGRGRRHGADRGRGVSQFLRPHTGREAGAIANAQAGAEYNPEIRNLREQAKGSRQRERDLASWYSQLAADYQAAQDSGSAALGSLEATTTQQLADANAASSADQARLAKEDESFANLVGGPKDTAGLAKIAQAGAAAARARVSINAPVEAEQANFVAALGGDKAAARMQGIEARQSERQRREKLRDQVAATQREKGAARVSNKEKIRESDRGYAAELAKLRLDKREARTAEESAAASAALARLKMAHEEAQDAIANRQAQERIGVSRRNAKSTESSNAVDARQAQERIGISRKNARTSARSQRVTARTAREAAAAKGKPTTAERVSQHQHVRDAESAARALLGIKVPKNARQWAQFEAALIEKLGSSYAAEARAAVARLRHKQAEGRRGAYTRRVRKGEVAGPPTPRG